MNDVKAAWAYYLAHENHGRGVVLIGHSQGSGVLTALIKQEIDGKQCNERAQIDGCKRSFNFSLRRTTRTMRYIVPAEANDRSLTASRRPGRGQFRRKCRQIAGSARHGVAGKTARI